MGLMALAGLIFALLTEAERRSHDRAKPPPTPLTVPFVLRFALGVYIIGLVYLVVRRLTRRSGNEVAAAGVRRPALGGFSIPILALVGLVLVVLVIQTSGDHKPRQETVEKPVTVHALAPADLPELGYLPVSANLMAGVHVAELRQGDRGGLVSLWLAAAFPGVNDLERRTGIKIEALDHAVLGLSGAAQGSQLTLVVQTLQPYDREAVRKALGPSREETYAGQPLYVGRWGALPQALVWCAAPRTLVVVSRPDGVSPRAMRTVPARPRTGSGKLPERFRALFERRPLPSGTPVWLAGMPRDRETVKQWLALTPLAQTDRKVLKRVTASLVKDGEKLLGRVETFAAGIRLDRQVTLTGVLRAPDGTKALQLVRLLRRRAGEERGWKVVHKAGGRWVIVQIKMDGKNLARAITGPRQRK
jgi:hypothetical protein